MEMSEFVLSKYIMHMIDEKKQTVYFCSAVNNNVKINLFNINIQRY